jgi:hypothetical protein
MVDGMILDRDWMVVLLAQNTMGVSENAHFQFTAILKCGK